MTLYKFIAFLLCSFVTFSNNTFAQQKNVSLTILDIETNLPVVFVPLLNLSQKSLSYSDENGIAILNYESISDIIEVCFMSYECQKFTISEVTGLEKDTVYLKQSPIQLETVNIHPQKRESIEIGYHKSKTDFKWGSGSGLIFANFYKNAYPTTPYISKIFIDLNSSVKEKANTLVRLRLFRPNSDGSPGEDLTNENLFYLVKRIQTKFEVNIDSLNITIPPHGIVVGLEIIGYYKKGKLETSKKGTYTIGICSTKDSNRSQVGSAWRYSTFEKKWFSANYGLGKDTMFKIGLELSD